MIFYLVFLPFCGEWKSGGGGGRRVKGPLGPLNHAPLRVYEISGITKSAGFPLVRSVVGFLLCTYSECFNFEQNRRK